MKTKQIKQYQAQSVEICWTSVEHLQNQTSQVAVEGTTDDHGGHGEDPARSCFSSAEVIIKIYIYI